MTTNANMTVCDANVVLRYLLQDNEILSEKAILIIENKDVFVTTEVIVEIIYVLNKVYQMPRELIANKLVILLNDGLIFHQQLACILEAIAIYRDTKLDFVDCVLISYAQNFGYQIESFDKKLQNYLKKYLQSKKISV